MTEFLKVNMKDGVFKTVLPPFNNKDWSKIVPNQGFIWIRNPLVEFSVQLESLLSDAIFNTTDLDLKYSIHRLELDISIPTIDFLRFTESKFSHGIDFILSEKHQPTGFNLDSISQEKWAEVMVQNQIIFTCHRPAAGEPSILTSPSMEFLNSVIYRLSRK
ncbi:hypothetical protein [Gimesia sp.]|uniref:hypothetical protein n=1 Tax=Gimesia sp. TaxID=2024833 RepID=UPI000C485FB6|nr:hypothetical protein [Gimesia sp.]MAX36365.1 hypothetical protein [Gimesia sp.]HAH46550.1 hypothetical protein [Planctomycetaceae bacterium]HBL45087.1 hypothetical protein [Planctomycetaceae bacterium]|tara:strand:+ start:2537 stop:3019 length:483 start_codon:yes stop_codon:yes gene_type:complete